MKSRLYLAAPLFCSAERTFNESVTAVLENSFNVFLPQRDGGLFEDLVAKGSSIADARRIIFERDLNAIREADIVLIVLDGRTVDEGAAFELGVAFTLGKRCVGLQTDVRRMLPSGNNPMIDCAVERVFSDANEFVAWIQSKDP